MALSLMLAKIIGIYVTLVCLAALVRRRELSEILRDFMANKALALFAGEIVLLLGILVAAVHNVWEVNWRGLITLIAWITIAKGALLLFSFSSAKRLSKGMMESGVYSMAHVFFLLAGIYLMYVGFNFPKPI